MTITVHHFRGARSVRLLWALEELDLEHDVVVEDPKAKSAALEVLNPLAKVPCLIDGDIVIQESTAALEFLANRYGNGRLALEPDAPDYPRYLQWLHAAEGTVMPPLFLVVAHTMLLPEDKRRPALADYGRAEGAKILGWLDQIVKDRAFIAGDRFTAADATVGYACFVGRFTKILDDRFPHLRRYWDGLKDRPAARAALAK